MKHDLFDAPWLLKELAVYEGLIRTASLVSTNLSLSTKYKIKPDWKKNTFKILISGLESKKEIKELLANANNLGWFPAGILKNDSKSLIRFNDHKLDEFIDSGIPFSITFEAKYDIEIFQSKVPKKLYHITPTRKIEKIKKNGLTPKSASKLSTHPDRIYVAISIESAKKLKTRMQQMNPEITDFTLIEIDAEELPIYIRFFRDPNFLSEGYYTLSNIFPIYLKFHKI